MISDFRRSPLAHRTPISTPDGRLSLSETAFSSMYILRGSPEVVAPAVKTVANVTLPTEAGTFTDHDGTSALWLGPDEWLIVQPDEKAQDSIKTALKSKFDDLSGQCVDVGDYYTTLAISGDAARDTLAKITMVDLHPRAFAKGNAIASIFGQAGAWLQMTDDETGEGASFALYVRRSMADYMWCLIADGGREYGLAPQEPIGQVKLHLPHFETAR